MNTFHSFLELRASSLWSDCESNISDVDMSEYSMKSTPRILLLPLSKSCRSEQKEGVETLPKRLPQPIMFMSISSSAVAT